MIKAYKGFNKDMTCRGFQYEEGKEYECKEASLCNTGFHACLDPLDCFCYYAPGESVFHEVEIEDNGERNSNDSMIVGTKIKVGAKLDVAKICKLHFDFVKERCEPVNSNAAGESGSASAGYRGSASAGYRGSASAGESGSASAGESGSASAGNYGSASAGESGSASAGESGSAVSHGSAEVGANGIAVVRGNGCQAKGGIGSILLIAEEKSTSYNLVNWKAIKIDGKEYKADTWYKLDKNGDVVEVEEWQ